MTTVTRVLKRVRSNLKKRLFKEDVQKVKADEIKEYLLFFSVYISSVYINDP